MCTDLSKTQVKPWHKNGLGGIKASFSTHNKTVSSVVLRGWKRPTGTAFQGYLRYIRAKIMALPPLSIQRQGGVGRETAAVLKTVSQQATPEIKTSKKHQP